MKQIKPYRFQNLEGRLYSYRAIPSKFPRGQSLFLVDVYRQIVKQIEGKIVRS